MNLINIFISVGVLVVIWYVTTTMRIYEAFRKRNIKVNWSFLRFIALQYVNQYKTITIQETNKIGLLFYHWIISIHIALVTAVLIFMKCLI